ncbi:MAG TPA: hypothetical protein VK948_06275 [Aeromicrobium sp.]|nr:hypothetical protein [Aeromicrobium sp.]
MSESADFRSVTQLRRAALFQDFLLGCLAFTGGALTYVVARGITDGADFWSIGLSDGLLLSGLVAGELFIIVNNGLRQGVRGHSIGKHRVGLTVGDLATRRPVGAVRGLLRGVLLAILLDLATAAVPVGLPTVLRETTPDSWHIGIATYLAIAVLVIPVILPWRRDVPDRILHTEVTRASGADATTTPSRRKVLLALDVVGVLGVIAVMATYLAFYAPFIFRFPGIL